VSENEVYDRTDRRKGRIRSLQDRERAAVRMRSIDPINLYTAAAADDTLVHPYVANGNGRQWQRLLPSPPPLAANLC